MLSSQELAKCPAPSDFSRISVLLFPRGLRPQRESSFLFCVPQAVFMLSSFLSSFVFIFDS
jgi:hypothetical protein